MSEPRAEDCICNAVVSIWPKGLLINLTNCQFKQLCGWWKIHSFVIILLHIPSVLLLLQEQNLEAVKI